MPLTGLATVLGITRAPSTAEDGGVLKASDTNGGGRAGAVVVDLGPDQHQALQHAERKARTYGKALFGLFSKVDTSKKNKELLALNPDAEAFLKEVFNRLDEDSSGEVTKNALENALNELYDSETAAGLTKLLPNEMKITQEQLATAIFSPRKRDFKEKLCLFLIMWVMPAAYSACTRLPFICVALEIVNVRGGTLDQVGLVLGGYQTCRAIANGIIGACGGTEPFYRLYLPMVAVGLAGWTVSLFLLDSGVLWLLVLGAVGLSEVVVCLQSGLIRESNKDWVSGSAPPKQVAANLRTQYMAVAVGSFIAYVFGGALYTSYGLRAICWCGIAMCSVQIFSFALYVVLARCSAEDYSSRRSPLAQNDLVLSTVAYQLEALDLLAARVDGESFDRLWTVSSQELAAAQLMVAHNHDIPDALGHLYHKIDSNMSACKIGMQSPPDGSLRSNSLASKMEIASHNMFELFDSDSGHVSEHEFVHFLAPRVYHALFGMSVSHVSIVWPYLRIVVITQAIMALCIGAFLSTALLLYTQEFGMSASTVGLLLGVGEGLGALTILYCSTSFTKSGAKLDESSDTGGFLQALFSRPLHVPMVLFIVGAVTMGFAVPNVVVAVICQMIMSSVNDLSVTFLNELTATSMPPAQFKANHSLGQWLRRLGNMLTGITGPLLFSVAPGLPFLVYGGIVGLWACFLWRALYSQAITVVPPEERVGSGPVSAFKPFAGSKPFHQYEREHYFSHRETLLHGRNTKALAVQLVDFEHTLGRMRAKLLKETYKRQQIEAEFVDLKATVALLSAGRGENELRPSQGSGRVSFALGRRME